MNFEYSEKYIALQEKLRLFIAKNIHPVQEEVEAFNYNPVNAWKKWQGLMP